MSKYPLNGKNYTVEDDISMITDECEWPCWPYLPVKKNFSELGVVFSKTIRDTIKIYLTNLYAERIINAPYVEYASGKEATDAGWRVD